MSGDSTTPTSPPVASPKPMTALPRRVRRPRTPRLMQTLNELGLFTDKDAAAVVSASRTHEDLVLPNSPTEMLHDQPPAEAWPDPLASTEEGSNTVHGGQPPLPDTTTPASDSDPASPHGRYKSVLFTSPPRATL
eukprot:CAMPEP_0175871564 /NCGR_PEP_ID=MMETSP0107_2-20121207/37210_1 /TAXON_ID=195067 ORGANISM="Goniomonas pacifica, Strain CCMP1869" /NCGR_SAMPLE_ID=MMETSP0107_2 /ASSEMBLY_ACC=CAM_ASM_000203 /LENGTH=134 /DNA_ID=CAMNT_0017189967 /DNA_START=470 /DNA_END=874 /DNA_ORIENTATION=+